MDYRIYESLTSLKSYTRKEKGDTYLADYKVGTDCRIGDDLESRAEVAD